MALTATTQTDKCKKPRGRPFQAGHVAHRRGRKPGSKNKPAHLPIPDAIAALVLAKKGKSPASIARALNARPDAVKEAVTHARPMLEAFAPELVMAWVDAAINGAKNGDHKPAMAALQSIKVVEPIAQTYDTQGPGAKATAAVQVQFVGFGFAGLPGQPQQQQHGPIDLQVIPERSEP